MKKKTYNGAWVAKGKSNGLGSTVALQEIIVLSLYPQSLEMETSSSKYSIRLIGNRRFEGDKEGFKLLSNSDLQRTLAIAPIYQEFTQDLGNLGNLIHHYLLQDHYTVQRNGKKMKYHLNFLSSKK